MEHGHATGTRVSKSGGHGWHRSRVDGPVKAMWNLSPDDEVPSQKTQFADLEGLGWLIGRMRLDARNELIAAIRQKGGSVSPADSDARLLLVSYSLWGAGFLSLILGEFCLVIWDARAQRLLSARDALGIRPLFHAKVGSVTLISDSLSNIAREIESPVLDELWIADFLAWDYSEDHERTVYRDIHRLRAAHALLIDGERTRIERYWTPGSERPTYFRKETDGCEQFLDLLRVAVRDRLPSGRVGVSLSGGLDSSTLVAETLDLLKGSERLSTRTYLYQHLVPDDEKSFVDILGRDLQFTPEYQYLDNDVYDPSWRDDETAWAEPRSVMLHARRMRASESAMEASSRVWFLGEGPDNALVFEWKPYLAWLWHTRQWARLFRDSSGYLAGRFRDPHARGIPQLFTGAKDDSSSDHLDGVSKWLEPDFAKRSQFRERSMRNTVELEATHPWHPKAVWFFQSSLISSFFEEYESSVTGTQLEWRHPFMDRRIVQFMLSLPPVPWARRKHLLRQSMRGRLPQEILLRPKTVPSIDPIEKVLPVIEFPLGSGSSIHQFIEVNRIPPRPDGAEACNGLLRVHVLEQWLRRNKR